MGLDDIVEEIKRIAQEKGFGKETRTDDGLRLSNGDKIIEISAGINGATLTLPSLGLLGLGFVPSLSIDPDGKVLGLDLYGSRGYEWLNGGARKQKQLEGDFVRGVAYEPEAVSSLLDAYVDANIQSKFSGAR